MSDSRAQVDGHWSALVAAFTLGTERRPFAPPEGFPARIDATDPARALLDSAAIMAQYRGAGALPPADSHALPTQADPDDKPLPPPAAIDVLGWLIQQRELHSLPEWATLCEIAACRTPDEYLPEVLQYGSNLLAVRPYFFKVLGKRGNWLAGRNDFWGWGRELGKADSGPYGLHGDESALLNLARRTARPDAAELSLITVFNNFWSIELTDAMLHGNPTIKTAYPPLWNKIMNLGAIELSQDIEKWLRENVPTLRNRPPETRLLEARIRIYRGFGVDGLPPHPAYG